MKTLLTGYIPLYPIPEPTGQSDEDLKPTASTSWEEIDDEASSGHQFLSGPSRLRFQGRKTAPFLRVSCGKSESSHC